MFTTRLKGALLLAFILCMTCINAQSERDFGAKLVDRGSIESMEHYFSAYTLYEIEVSDIEGWLQSEDYNYSFSWSLPGTGSWQIALFPYELKGKDYILRSSRGIIPSPKTISFRGHIGKGGNTGVRLVVSGDYLSGSIRENGVTWYIEPAFRLVNDAPRNVFVVYKQSDVIPDPNKTCLSLETEAFKQQQLEPKIEKLPGEIEGEALQQIGDCYDVAVAVAHDKQMFDKYGSVAACEGHATSVMNNVGTNWDDEFADEIQFYISEQYVEEDDASFPTPSNNAGQVLSSFRTWANGGGFNNPNYAVGQLWTARDFTGGTVGIAYLNAVCGGSKYHALQDFTNNLSLLRVLTSHELGHNFSCQHDAAGSGFIMAPSVNNSNTWSNASINAVNNFVPNLGCLGSCSTGQPPVANFTGTPTEGCAPLSVQYTDLSLNSPSSWDWSFPGGTPSTSSQQNPTVTYNTDGVYDATLIVSNNAGSDTYTQTNYIDVNDDPFADFNYFDNELVVEFFNTSLRADEVTWDFGDGTQAISGPPAQNIPGGTHQGRTFGTFGNPTHVYDEDGTYVVQLTAINDCGASQRTQAVEVVSPVTAEFSSDVVDGCATLEVNFESQSSYNVTQWFWEFPGGVPSTSNQENPQVFYDEEGEYEVVLEVQNSRYIDRVVKTQYITVRDVPATSFTHKVNNKSVSFTNTSQNANTLFWDFGDGDISNQQNPIHTYQEDSTYTVMLIGTNTCGDDTAFATVLIGSPPTAGFTSDVTEGCPPLTVNFENLSSPNATHYEWEFSGGNPETSINKNPTVTYDNSGEYNVVLIAHNGVGSDTVTLTNYIDVLQTPIADFGSEVGGYEVDFTNQSQFGNSYHWDFGDGNVSNTENPNHTYDLDGTYTVKLTVENDCGQDVIEKSVVIANPPAAGFTQDTLGGCADLTIEFQNQSSENSVSYEWHFPGGTPDTSYDENPEVLYDSAGVYDVTLIAFNPQGADTTEKQQLIEINEGPVAAFESDVNMEMVIFTNKSDRTDTFEWDFGDGNTSSEENPVHRYESNGIYEVWLSVENECGKHSVMYSVEIDAYPTADFDSEEQTGCSPFEVQYFNNSTKATSFEWEFEGGTPAVSTEEEPVVTYTAPGKYMVRLVVNNGIGSDISIKEEYIEVIPDPEAAFDFSVNGYTANFTNESSNATSYSWNFGDGNVSDVASPMHEFELPGSYLVELIATGTCGTDTISETVQIVDQTPVITINTSTNTGCPTLTVQFRDMSDNNPESWLWTFEGGNPGSSTEQNPEVAFEEPGVYKVTLEVSNQYGTSKAVYDSLIRVHNEPIPDFVFEQRGDTVMFTNMASHYERIEWHFGDGNTSNEENPVHVYENNGVYEVTQIAINNCGSVTKQTEVVIQVSGVYKRYELGDFTIYPNPNDGSFNIKMAQQALQGDITLEIKDMFGKSIDQTTLSAFNVMNGVQYQMPQQLSGTYFVILQQANKVTVRKIVVVN